MSPRAFVSSTYEDLKQHRKFVIRALRAAGFDVDPMEEGTATPGEPKESCLKEIERCDLFILLIAFRRGFVPPGDVLSITQQEYEHAVQQGKDVLAFLLEEGTPWEARFNELATDAQLQVWRTTVAHRHSVGFFGRTATATSIPIADALPRWERDRNEREQLRRYRAAIREAHGDIKFLGMPDGLNDNHDVRIDRLFVDPYLSPTPAALNAQPEEWGSAPLLQVVKSERRLVLLGGNGCGKSTVVNWIAWQLAQEGPNAWKEALGECIPVPLVLHKLSIREGVTWDTLLAPFLVKYSGQHLGGELLRDRLRAGKVLVLLDGLDEIGSAAVRGDLRVAVQHAMREYSGCRWLLTSRVVGYDVPFHLDPDEEKAQKTGKPEAPLPSSTDAPPSRRPAVAAVHYAVPFNDDQIKQFARNWYREREKETWKAAEEAEKFVQAVRAHPDTTQLARVPNLLTIMALIHRGRARFPNVRALLYDAIASAYLETIDGYRNLLTTNDTLTDKKLWLARVGFAMQERHSAVPDPVKEHEILVGGEELRRWIADGMKESGQVGDPEDARRFIEFIAKRSGLLIERDEDLVGFIHLSFQEYFAAWYLYQHTRTEDWAYRGQSGGLTLDRLRELADTALWRGTLIVLFELKAALDSGWKKALMKWVFGADWAKSPEMGLEQKHQGRWLLLARLAAEPYSGLSEESRTDARRLVCRWEVRRQAQKAGITDFWFHDPSGLDSVLGDDPQQKKRHLEILVEEVNAEHATSLTVRNVSVSDIAPLEKAVSLERLCLEGTGVTDLSPLAKLPRLRRLHIDNTPVTDLTPLAGVGSLKELSLVRTLVSDQQVRQLRDALAGLRTFR